MISSSRFPYMVLRKLPLSRWTKNNSCRFLCPLIVLVGVLFTFSSVTSVWQILVEKIGIAITHSCLAITFLQPRTRHIPSAPIFESNATHLWSIRLADDEYFRVARLLPCRTVIYTGGPVNDVVNSCDHSPTSEFSVAITVKAQKWLFDHQHPHDCSNKKFAIINNYALSGLGSTLHQIVSAISKALVEDRIAVYASPGNWVSFERFVTRAVKATVTVMSISHPSARLDMLPVVFFSMF